VWEFFQFLGLVPCGVWSGFLDMVSYRRLLATVEAAVLVGAKPEPQHRADLSHALHVSFTSFESFLKYPAPKAEDRAQVVSREVRLPNAPPTTLDDQDAQIALKLSDDYNLNEIDCVGLLVAAHQEWNLLGREPLEILRLAAGLWFTERRALITSLQLLLRVSCLSHVSMSSNDHALKVHHVVSLFLFLFTCEI
jgi:nuclear pore complex protein Nup205